MVTSAAAALPMSSTQVILVRLTLFPVFLLFVLVFAVAILAGDDISEFIS
jgi:hypothetical protein